MNPFDLCVIGCGPGGFAGAIRAADLGARTCIVESGAVGGAGVVWGALASKTMWELAKDFDIASRVDRGYTAVGLEVDFKKVRQVITRAIREKQGQMVRQIRALAPGHGNKGGSVQLFRGRAEFTGPHQLKVRSPKGIETQIRADRFLIATGSRPATMPGIHINQRTVFDSNGILGLRQFPRKLMVIGAGVIGCEFASIFANFKKTDVLLVDNKERILPYEDEDVSRFVSRNLEEKGVRLIHSARLQKIDEGQDGAAVELKIAGRGRQTFQADAVLISVGRVPDLAGLKLPAAGIQSNSRGYLDVDADCRVADHIAAAGDVVQHPALVNIAEAESRHAVDAMFGMAPPPLNYRNMSFIMFFYPEVAAVGLSEQDCRAKKLPYRVAWYAHAFLCRAIAMRATRGFVKIIVNDAPDPQILGMRAAGPQVSSTITAIALMMARSATPIQSTGIREILKTLHPHPTISEGIQECLRLLCGESAYKPSAFPNELKTYRWNPKHGYFLDEAYFA